MREAKKKMNNKYVSNAKWSDEVSTGTLDNVSKDYHRTEEQAENVCRMLKKRGLGGEGKIFPIKTWVDKI